MVNIKRLATCSIRGGSRGTEEVKDLWHIWDLLRQSRWGRNEESTKRPKWRVQEEAEMKRLRGSGCYHVIPLTQSESVLISALSPPFPLGLFICCGLILPLSLDLLILTQFTDSKSEWRCQEEKAKRSQNESERSTFANVVTFDNNREVWPQMC